MKYPANFVQNIDPVTLAALPKFCRYDGDAKDLRHLVGLVLETATVEQLVYVGERENIVCDDAEGLPVRPWKFIEITELDGAGKPVVSGWQRDEPLPTHGPRAMSTGDLGALGLTDAKLADLAKTELGEVYEPDRPGPSDLRRSVYDRVMAKVFG